MNFNQFGLLPFDVEEGSYIANAEVCDRIRQAVEDYYYRTRFRPVYLLLGYGTYFSLCITVSEKLCLDSGELPNHVEKLTHFLGIPILLDSGYEFRVACIASNNPFEDALNIYFHNKRLKKMDTF